MSVLVLDAGHGGTDSGAVYRGENEKDITLATVLLVKTQMDQVPGFSCFLTRGFDFFLSLEARCRIANSHRGDLFISIHCNADPDDDTNFDHVARGDEVWIHPGSVGSRRFADILQKYVYKYSKIHRGIKESSGLYVLRNTKMPAALVEIGFIDDPEFVAAPPIVKAAEAICDSIKEYFVATDT